MGYRKPSYDEVDDTDDQFEWDGDKQRWLFRRNGRGAPIVVTDEEKERCEAIWQRGMVVRAVVLAVVYHFGGSLVEKVYTSSKAVQLPIGIVVVLVLFGPARALVDWIATRRFLNRHPVGPALTRLDDWRMRAEPTSWPALVLLLTLMVGATWGHWPPSRLEDGMALGMAGLIARSILFATILKAETSRL